MRYCQFIVFWVLLLAAGCARTPHRLRGTPSVEASVQLDADFAAFGGVRIRREHSVLERQFPSDSACSNAATKYYQNVLHATDTPTALLRVPRTYSFRKSMGPGERAKEIRFVAGRPTGRDVRYLEVKQTTATPTDDTNRQDLLAAIAALGPTVTMPQGPPVLDSHPINGKRAWRVLLSTSRTIQATDNSLTIPVGTFGLMTNPPYPP